MSNELGPYAEDRRIRGSHLQDGHVFQVDLAGGNAHLQQVSNNPETWIYQTFDGLDTHTDPGRWDSLGDALKAVLGKPRG